MLSIKNKYELGFQSSARGMEDNELEEGEAVSCQDEFIDPDVAFSHLDEKLQNVLGHFLKDFDGGLSAENLGSKFGQFGSFLPTRQRFPATSSQPRSLLKPPSPTISKSPLKSSAEKPPASRGSSPTKNNPVPVTQNRCAPYVSSNKFKSVTNGSDQKSLKVRIKLGPNNTLTRSNAAIYSGLGLDTSPSSSAEDIPEACQSLPTRARDAPGESPSTILQAMASFSVPGGYLLSPLSAYLSKLTENDSFSNRKADNTFKSDATPVKQKEGYLENDKMLSFKKDRVMEEDNLYCKMETSRKLKNKIDVNVSTSNQSVSNSLSMPLQACSGTANPKAEKLIGGDSGKNFGKSSKAYEGTCKHKMTDKTSLLVSAKVVDQVKLKKTAKIASSKGKLISKSKLSEKSIEEINLSRHKATFSDAQKEENNTNYERNNNSKSVVEHKSSYDRDSNAAKSSKLMSAHKAVLYNCHAGNILQRVDKNQVSKISRKMNHNDGTLSNKLFQTNSAPKVPTYIMANGKKSFHSVGEDDKSSTSISCKVTKKMHSKQSTGNDGAQGVENTQMLLDKKPEAKKIVHIHPEPAEASIFDSNSDAAVALPAPPVINQNWVCCDKCEIWRLLPYGQDPNNLPKEWLCIMQDWLPGLNKCYISEDITTKAFNERFVAPAHAPEAGTELNGHHDINLANNKQLSDTVLDQDTETFFNDGKKEAGVRTSNVNKTLKLKKKLQPDKTDANDCPRETNSSFKAVPCKTTGLKTKKFIHKFNGRLQSRAQYSDGEEVVEKGGRDLKSNSKAEFSQDELKPPKKIKKEKSDADYMVDGVVSLTVSGLPVKIAGKILRKNSDHSASKDSKGEIGGKSSSFIKRSKDSHLIANYKDKSTHDKSDTHEYAAKKRKVREWQQSQQAQKDTVTTTEKQTRYAKECLPEGEPMTQKTKLSNFEKRDNTNISNVKSGKSDWSAKILLPTSATNSSSSKVSSSRKRKVGSPVESVSSSPLRTSVAKKVTVGSCKDMVNTDSCLTRSQNRCSEGEVGCDQSGKRIKETGNSGSQTHIKEAGNSGSQIKTTEESLDEPFSKTKASHLVHAECKESNAIVDAEKDHTNSDGHHKLNNHHYNSNGNSNFWNSDKDVRTVKRDVNMGIKTEAPDSDGNKIDLYVTENARSNCSNSFNSHEPFKDDKKSDALMSHQSTQSDALMSHQSTLNRTDNKSEIIIGDKRIPSKLMRTFKDKPDAQSSGSQVVAHTPINNDVTTSHELVFAKQPQTPESHGGMHLNNSSQRANGRQCSSMTASDAVIKNARGLKHTANHMKNDGKRHESIGIYFESALQFLHGSFLMEPLNENATTYRESNLAVTMMNMYSDTAKLFKYCAHEYETSKEMAGVALAFKCVEVAYMKVAYYMHATASKDQLELLTALQTIFPGESPSSSASDVDNLNNNGVVDKIDPVKAANLPQIAGKHIIAARQRPNFVRLLEYTKYMNLAFDATRKSQIAIAAASVGMKEDGVDRLSSVRQALDFNFHNVEELVRFIRVSKESINL